MSEHLAVAVEKANLFREAEKKAQQLSVLNTIGAAVSQSLNLDLVLNAAIDKMIETLNFDASWIYIVDPSQEQLELRAFKGLDEQSASGLDQPESSARLNERILTTGERLILEEYENETEHNQPDSRNGPGAGQFASLAGFPIKAKERVIGVLHLASKEKRHLATDELQLIASIAQEIGVAADNAQLFEQVNSKTQELSLINKELDDANRAKSEFISAMSHELRTPLNVIMGNAELTGDGFWGKVNAEQIRSMGKIRHHAQFLLKLVNDVLALSRLDAKKMSLELSTVDIDAVVTHVQGHVEQLNRSKGLDVCWEVDRNLPDIVTDETKLEEILQNLLGNAFKFTPRGQIIVRVKNVQAEKLIEFCVADTGVGIEAQDMERIFGAFEQIREAHTGEFNGVGLGLSIVKNYLGLMQGDIRVESRPGEGSKFTFTVPHSLPIPS
jgi:signal transduction histidine kinase